MQKDLDRLKPKTHLGPRSTCLHGTRVETIGFVLSWIARSNGSILWLSGLAGTGKSSIMGTIACHAREMGVQSRLGAFIRFDRLEMNDPSGFFTSLAYELSHFDNEIGKLIAEVVKRRPDIADCSFSTQCDDLITKPLKSIGRLPKAGPLVILIDGMDECKRSDKRDELLHVLSSKLQPNLPFLKVVIASRPEHDLEVTFISSEKPWITPYPLDQSSDAVDQDIRRYFENKLGEIQDPAFHTYCHDNNAIGKLTERASGLFIWADTVYRFIKMLPKPRIAVVLNTSIPLKAQDALTTLYTTALDSILSENGCDDDITHGVMTVLGSVVTAKHPLTVPIIDGLFFPDDTNVGASDFLQKLVSVATVSDDGIVRLLHKSFDDFLLAPSRCGLNWYIDTEAFHRRMTI